MEIEMSKVYIHKLTGKRILVLTKPRRDPFGSENDVVDVRLEDMGRATIYCHELGEEKNE